MICEPLYYLLNTQKACWVVTTTATFLDDTPPDNDCIINNCRTTLSKRLICLLLPILPPIQADLYVFNSRGSLPPEPPAGLLMKTTIAMWPAPLHDS